MPINITAVEVNDFVLKSWSCDACVDEMLAQALAAQEFIAAMETITEIPQWLSNC